MASYLVVKQNSTSNKSIGLNDSQPSQAYLEVKSYGYVPLTTETGTGGIKVKKGNTIYKIQESYTTTVTSSESYSYDTSSTRTISSTDTYYRVDVVNTTNKMVVSTIQTVYVSPETISVGRDYVSATLTTSSAVKTGVYRSFYYGNETLAISPLPSNLLNNSRYTIQYYGNYASVTVYLADRQSTVSTTSVIATTYTGTLATRSTVSITRTSHLETVRSSQSASANSMTISGFVSAYASFTKNQSTNYSTKYWDTSNTYTTGNETSSGTITTNYYSNTLDIPGISTTAEYIDSFSLKPRISSGLSKVYTYVGGLHYTAPATATISRLSTSSHNSCTATDNYTTSSTREITETITVE